MLTERISELCKKHGTTIWKLEKELGFANASISRWSKSYPSVDRLKKVADRFGVTVDQLLSDASLSEEALYFAKSFDCLSEDKKKLIKCYISVIQSN